MPVRQTVLKEQTLSLYKNHSYEYLLLSWLLKAGWDASMPSLDVYAKTDIQILDGRKVYRLQVKSLDSVEENIRVENRWGEIDIDFIVYFSRNAEWGYIAPAFKEKHKNLKSNGHVRFNQHPNSFIKAFSKI